MFETVQTHKISFKLIQKHLRTVRTVGLYSEQSRLSEIESSKNYIRNYRTVRSVL